MKIPRPPASCITCNQPTMSSQLLRRSAQSLLPRVSRSVAQGEFVSTASIMDLLSSQAEATTDSHAVGRKDVRMVSHMTRCTCSSGSTRARSDVQNFQRFPSSVAPTGAGRPSS